MDNLNPDSDKPSYLPDWFPKKDSLGYFHSLAQILIVGLAAGYLLYHLMKGRIGKAASTAAGG